MNPLSRIGSDLGQLLKPFVPGTAGLSPLADAATGSPVQKALLKAVQDGNTKDATQSAARVTDDPLGRDAFLMLLVQQMQYQDPLAPTDNAEMIAQLAQFSALEQMHNLNEQFQEFSGNLDQLNFLSASSMIGRTVRGIANNGSMVEGEVTGVQMQGSVVYLTVGNQQLSMAGVHTIS
ncbi:MAG: hypothetical protein AMXMBFR4_21610 [Candidatus Hydrogenedentota bacterium]